MPPTRTRVLVVHRDRDLTRRIRDQFDRLSKFDVQFVKANADTRELLSGQTADVIVLDLSVTAPPGFEVYRVLESRSASPPVILLRPRQSRRTAATVRWAGGEGIEALEARLLIALGRGKRHSTWLPLRFEGVHLRADLPNTHVSVDGAQVPVSSREAELLGVLLAQVNSVVRREVLADIWGFETRSLDVYVLRLRRKLGAAGAQIETVKGFGYRFNERPTAVS